MEEKEETFDVIIIGGGPAGLSAALYSARRALKTLVITRDIGGQASKTPEIENYPGIEKISGIALAMEIKKQAEKFGAKIIFEETSKIEKKNEVFDVSTLRGKYTGKTIILASGKKPRELGAEGEEKLKGKGVSYCATCDVPFFKDKVVAVVGGGNSALDAALLAEKYCKKVYIVHRRASFTAEEVLIEKVKSSKKIEVIFDDEVTRVNGENHVESISLMNSKEISVDGLIVEVGYIVDRSLVKDLVEIDEKNQIVADSLQNTSVPGIFAAGDITQTPYKQIAVSAAEGVKAALSSYDYLQRREGKKGISGDWH